MVSISHDKNKIINIVFYVLASLVLFRSLSEIRFIFTATEDHVFGRIYEISGYIDAFVFFQSIYLLFCRKVSLRWSVVFAIVAMVIEEHLFFEEILPVWLHSAGLGGWIRNEEQPRGVLMIAVFLIHIFYFIRPKLRSFERTLNLMLLFSVIGTFILFHFIMIRGAMRDVEHNFATYLSSSKISEPGKYETLCADMSYNCIKVKDGKVINTTGEDDVDMNGYMFNTYLKDLGEENISRTGVITKEDGHMRNYSLYAEKRDGTTYAIYEMKFFQILKRRIANGFYRLNIVAHFVWTIFVLALIWLHRELRVKPTWKAFFRP